MVTKRKKAEIVTEVFFDLINTIAKEDPSKLISPWEIIIRLNRQKKIFTDDILSN